MHRLSLLLALFICGLAPDHVLAQEDAKTLAVQARGVLKRYCHQCHAGPGSDSGHDFDMLKVETLTAKTADLDAVVVPGKPDQSLLLKVMAKRMPPKAIKDRPSDADRAIIEKWIQAGAPAPAEDKRAFLSVHHVLKTIRDDLQAVGLKDQLGVRFQRYFSLTHLHNNPGVTSEDLAVYRAALAKALNSLSWENAIVVPRPVDKEGTVLAVDVRDLGWDQQDLWRALLCEYPYGLRYNNHPDPLLRALDLDLARLGGCELVYLRADWFVAVATRPPLYHTLLRLPTSDWLLENKLSVDVRENFRNGKLARAGFAKSGVSGQNRLVERHKAAYGAYWKSYDFKEKNANNDLKQQPLGPLNLFPAGQHPYAKQAFVHDGGELIFNLPNGLQAYLLINGRGDRIDQGPEDVVSDSLKTSGTNAIVNGLSCMACHVQGTITFKDQIRDGAAVFGEGRTKVGELYPESTVMEKWLKEDEARFMEALRKSMGQFFSGGEDLAKLQGVLKKVGEPVGVVARAYRLQPLDLAAVAYELGLQHPADLRTKIGDGRLRELGLAVLLQKDGVLNRVEWDTLRARSLMQRVAAELDATPLKVVQ
jgi:mono/diheme cytochrome c family protein